MSQVMVIKLSMNRWRDHHKALKCVSCVNGVVSAALNGDQAEVIGVGVDGVALTQLLRRILGFAQLVSCESVGYDKEMTEELKVVIKASLKEPLSRAKALKIVMAVKGVQSVKIQGQEGDQMEVTGVGVDPGALMAVLRKKLVFAQLVSISHVGDKKEVRKEGGGGDDLKNLVDDDAQLDTTDSEIWSDSSNANDTDSHTDSDPESLFILESGSQSPARSSIILSKGNKSSKEDELGILGGNVLLEGSKPLDFLWLRVVDLSYTKIKSLCQSVSRLVGLQRLILKGCELLMELPPEIGELRSLEVLDLEGTEIICLPKEIAKLMNLWCLRLSFYGFTNEYQESKWIDAIIPRGVLSSLKRLKELSIDVNPDGNWWEVEVKTIISDIFSLKNLTTLKLYFPTVDLLKDVRGKIILFPNNIERLPLFADLSSFRFVVGSQEQRFISRVPHEIEGKFNKMEKALKYTNGEGVQEEVTVALKYANAFFLDHHWTVRNLSEFGLENMSNLKFCCLAGCNEFQSIMGAKVQSHKADEVEGDTNDSGEICLDFDVEVVLEALEYLSVHYMKSMESICKRKVGKRCLSNLKFLGLHTCPNLTIIFTLEMLVNLINLEELIIEDCFKVRCLVSLESFGSHLAYFKFLPRLKKISLLELPELVSISGGLRIAPNLESMVIYYCPKLEKLSTTDVSSNILKVIRGEIEWWDALKWQQSDVITGFQHYLACRFIPLKRGGDLKAQLTTDFATYLEGIDESSLVDDQRQKLGSVPVAAAEENLKEEWHQLKLEVELIKQALVTISASKICVESLEGSGKVQTIYEQYLNEAMNLEMRIEELEVKVPFGQKAIKRPGNGAGRFLRFPRRPRSQSGAFERVQKW